MPGSVRMDHPRPRAGISITLPVPHAVSAQSGIEHRDTRPDGSTPPGGHATCTPLISDATSYAPSTTWACVSAPLPSVPIEAPGLLGERSTAVLTGSQRCPAATHRFQCGPIAVEPAQSGATPSLVKTSIQPANMASGKVNAADFQGQHNRLYGTGLGGGLRIIPSGSFWCTDGPSPNP